MGEIRDNAVTGLNQSFPDATGTFNYVTDVVTADAVEVELELLQNSGTSQTDIAITLRNPDATGLHGYSIFWSIGGLDGDALGSHITIDRPGQSFADVIQSSTPIPAGSYTLRAEILPTGVINVSINGTLVATVTDPAPLPRGTAGLIYGGPRPPNVRVTSFTAEPDQSVNVTCLPANPMRGTLVSCHTSLARPESYTVIRRTATGTNLSVVDSAPVPHQPGDTNVWQGLAAASSDVVVEVEIGSGSALHRLTNQTPAHFSVSGRNWPSWGLTTLVSHTTAVLAPGMTDYPLPGTRLGLFQPDVPSAGSFTLERAPSGPNNGIAYIRDPFLVTGYLVATHPALYPATATSAGAKRWIKDQNGKGSGTCKTTAQISTLAASVERHEGVTKTPNSHFGVGNQQFAQLRPHMQMEALYSQANDTVFRAEVDQKLLDFFNTGPYRTAQAQFDTTDTPVVMASAGCTFDFNPNDH